MAHRSRALRAYDREHDAVLAEYRRREKDAPGSGDRWISTRTAILQELRSTDAGASPQVRLGSGSGPGSNLHGGDSMARTASGEARHAHTRKGGRRRLSTLLGGGGA